MQTNIWPGWKKYKSKQNISLSNQLYPVLFIFLQLFAGPQGAHRVNSIISTHFSTCVSISGETWWRCYRLECTPLFFVTRGYCLRAKRLWEPLMKSTCSPAQPWYQISLLHWFKDRLYRQHSSAQTQQCTNSELCLSFIWRIVAGKKLQQVEHIVNIAPWKCSLSD